MGHIVRVRRCCECGYHFRTFEATGVFAVEDALKKMENDVERVRDGLQKLKHFAMTIEKMTPAKAVDYLTKEGVENRME